MALVKLNSIFNISVSISRPKALIYSILLLSAIGVASIETVAQTTTQTFTTSGTFTVPAGVTSIKVETWGGGGAGGGSNTNNRNGGGGGGGAYAASNLTVSATQIYTVTVGGATNGAAGSGATGSTSSFISVLLSVNISALGGSGGQSFTAGAAGGSGATAGISGNITNTAGSSGSSGGNCTCGAGGDGANAVGTGGTARGSNGTGNAGVAPGGGGAGARGNNNGGQGAAGQVVVTYTLPNVSNLSVATSSTVCAGNTASFTISSNTLQTGNYTITYNVTGTSNSISSTTATFSFTAGSPGTATFTTATSFSTVETDILHITQITDNGTANFVSIATSNTSFTVSNCRSWYSYSTGNFNNYKSWTLDPSGTTFLNGNHITPGYEDDITILNGNTITSNINNLTLNSATIQNGGVLDMSNTTGHNLGVISGAGLLRVKGIALPLGTYTDFVAASTGGTIEYYDVGGTLPTTQTTYNNLKLTNSGSSSPAVIFVEASDLTVNGTFIVGSATAANTATWQINDDVSATQRKISITGDLTVTSNGVISVGQGNPASPHTLNFKGNIINNGTIRLFNNTAGGNFLSDTNWTNGNVFATTTVVGYGTQVTFSNTVNQTITCNNITYFYELVVNKGTGQQSVLTINSTNATNFRLYGSANLGSSNTDGYGDGPTTTSNNALSVVNGTLQLTGAITIPILTVGTNTINPGGGATNFGAYFAIPLTAGLWINGANVNVTVANNLATNSDNRLLINGLFRLTNGTVTTGYSKGLNSGAGGNVLIEGGTLNTWQVRPTTTGLQNSSYVQSGGTVNVGMLGISDFGVGAPGTQYSRFSIIVGGFQMSGGTLNIGTPSQNSTLANAQGIDIQSTSANYSVTGGVVNAYVPTAGFNFGINSTAPLYNLNIYKDGASGAFTAILAQPLTVLHKLTIITTNSPILDCNNQALTLSGDMEIQPTATLTPGTNTITFNGTGAQTWTHNGTITSLNNVLINKATGTLTLAGSNTFPNITGTTTGLTLASGTLNDGGKTITVTTALINNATHTSTGSGSITYSYSNTVTNGTIGGTNGTFGNLILSGDNTVIIMIGNQTVTGNLSFKGAAAATTPELLHLGSNSLTVNGSITSVAGFGHNCYISTNGLHNASGLTRSATAGIDVLFPVGVKVDVTQPFTTTGNRQYTPNTINVSSATSFGTITVRPVNKVHPNVTATNASLAYYWRVTSSGFTGLGTVTHNTYQFDDGTGTTPARNGTKTAYVAARYDRSANSWGYYNGLPTGGQTMTPYILTTPPNNSPYPFNTAITWTNVTGSQLDGEYTCGNSAAFGPITTYYSITTGNWNASGTWSTDNNLKNSGATCSCFPPSGSTSPVVIGDGSLVHVVTVPTGSGAAQMCGTLSINTNSTLDCGTNANAEGALGFGTNTTLGSGTLRIGLTTSTGTTGHFPSGDFTNFVGSGGGTVEYYGTTTTGLTIPSTYNSPIYAFQPLVTYYNLVVSPFAGQTITLPASSLTIYNNFTLGSASSYTGTTVTNGSPQTISVGGNLMVSYGTFNFINTPSTSTTTLNVTGNIVNNGTLSCAATTANNQTNTHLITVLGGITNNNVMNLRQYTSGTRYNFADITFNGTSNVSFGGTGTGGTTLDLVTVNKGTSQAPTVTCSLGGALNTPAVAAGWLTLTNGTFDFEYTGATTPITLSTTSYTIPSTTKLKVGTGTVAITNASGGTNDLFLSGTLEVAGGSVYTQTTTATGSDNDIEYAAAGTPSIIVSAAGSLSVDGSIRRSTSTLTGALVYNQTGGTVTVGGNNASTVRGVFEIDYNTGSSFTLTSGTLNVQRQNGGTGYDDVYINPVTSNVSSASTISVGLSTTAQNNLRVYIVPAVGNFAVVGGSNTQTVNLYNDLTVGGTLTIASPSTLDATQLSPDANVTIAGNFNCSGTYTGGTNTTTFNGTGAQSAVLTSTTNLYNVTVNKSAGTITLSGTAPAIPGLNNLNILSGTLEVGNAGTPLNNTLKVNRNIIITGSQIGTQAIEVYSTGITNTITSSNGSFTKLTLGGTVAKATVGVSGNLTINGTLNLLNGGTSRYLYIGSNQLTFGSSAPSPSNAASTAFIKTNGVASDLGVVKSWAGSGAFSYQVGTSSNWTPVSYSGLNVTTAGTLTVVPVNSAHNTATPKGANGIGTDYLLSYYWTVTRSSSLVATPSGSFTFQCPISLRTGSAGTFVPGYLDPNALASNGGWVTNVAGSTAGIASGIITMTFLSTPTTDFPSASPYYYDYSAGTGVAPTATLPNPIKGVYSRTGIGITPGSGGGNWSTGSNWTFQSGGDPTNAFPGSVYSNPFYAYPQGLPVTISSGTQINMDTDGLIAYKTTINGVLYNGIPSTVGHNLGAIDGNGTFRTATGTFPAGTYDAFVLPSPIGGTIEYAATTTMNSRAIYNNVIISNSIGTPSFSTVTMTTTPLTVNGNITVNAGNTLAGDANGGITLAGNFINAGTSTAGSGVLISIAGSMTNSLGGIINASSSTVNITGNLQNTGTFNGGSASVNLAGNLSNTGTGTIVAGTGTFTFNGTTAQTITGVTNFNNLTINNTFATSPQITIISGDQTVNSTLTLTKGNVNLNSASTTMTMGTASCASTGAVSLGATPGWIYGGKFKRYFAANTTINDGSLAGNFPVGNSTDYRPFYIGVTGMTSCSSFTLSVGAATNTTVVNISDPNGNSAPTPIVLQYQGYWLVSSSGASDGTYDLEAGGTGFGMIGNLTDLSLCTSGSVVGKYSVATGSTTDPRLNRTGLVISEMSNQFYVGSTDAIRSPLPIKLLSFTGNAKEYGVDLQWTTASEMNSDHFTVLRSAKGDEFESIGTVKGNGTTSSSHSYSLIDYKPLLGKNYYQLKQTDFDGRSISSETIIVNVLNLDPLVSIYPNPLSSNQMLNVEVNGLEANTPAEIQIISTQGTKVKGSTSTTDSDGALKTSVELTGLSAGLYILKVQDVHYKFVIE